MVVKDNLVFRTDDITKCVKENNPFNALISLLPDIKERSQVIQDKMEKGDDGILAGLLIGVKDNICVKGLPTTCGSLILKNFIPPYNAIVIEKIFQQDGLIIGKINMDEFAMGSSSEHSCFGPVRNPIDETKVPGGSSGGSAAAVSGGLVDVALGSDTGGSIRQLAAFCGIVGLKPTYGRVSRYGLVAFASSLDQIGTFSKTVEGSATLLGVIAGIDGRDSTSIDIQVPDYTANLDQDIKGLRIGIPAEYFEEGLNKEIKERIKSCINFFKKCGAEIKQISLQIPLMQLQCII